MNEAVHNPAEQDEPWKRVLYIILFLIINSVLKGVVLFTAVAQFLHVVIKSEVNPFIADFSEGLSNYSYHITRYVTYLTDKKPFPFAAWDNKRISH